MYLNDVMNDNLGPYGGGSGPGGSFKGWEKLLIPLPSTDPDGQEFYPVPPNERTIGISSEPDRDLGQEVEV